MSEAAWSRAHRVVQPEEAVRRIAVRGDRDVRPGGGDRLRIAHADALSRVAALAGHLRARVRDVGADRAERRVQHAAQHCRHVAFGHRHAAVAGERVREPALPRRLHEQRRRVVEVANRAGREAVAVLPRTQRQRDRRERHGERVDGAVRFRHGHMQIAAVAGRVQIVDHERARRDRRFVQPHPVLRDRDLRVRVRDAAHDRRITALGFRQHPVVGVQPNTAERRRIEQIAGRIRIADNELRRPARDIALQIGRDVLIAPPAAIVPAERTVVPEMPALHVQAAVETDVALRVAVPAAHLRVVGVRVVAEHRDRHAGRPLIGTHVPARAAAHRDLRNAQIEPLLAEVETDGRVGNDLADTQARLFLLERRANVLRQACTIDADPVEQRAVEARLRVGRVRGGLERNVGAADPAAVDVDVRRIAARPHDVAAPVA